jgi:hypothetical protein
VEGYAMPVSTPGCGSGELIESIICLRDVTLAALALILFLPSECRVSD